jgi:hypothetical protein
MKGHNEMTEEEMIEQQAVLRTLREVRDGKSEIAEMMGSINEAYKIAKPYGYTKADIKWALSLDEKDSGEVIEEMQRRIKLAKMLGHGLGRQIELFPDRTPVVDKAYEQGLAAGKLRKSNSNPYDHSSEQGQAWQRGMNDGTEFINKELGEVISSSDPFPVEGDEKPKVEGKKTPPKPDADAA